MGKGGSLREVSGYLGPFWGEGTGPWGRGCHFVGLRHGLKGGNPWEVNSVTLGPFLG